LGHSGPEWWRRDPHLDELGDVWVVQVLQNFNLPTRKVKQWREEKKGQCGWLEKLPTNEEKKKNVSGRIGMHKDNPMKS
jgi:hypothetical protein